VLLAATLCGACSSRERDRAHLSFEVRAARAEVAPRTDGRLDDAAWSAATETIIALENSGTGPDYCRVRAVVVDERLHLLVTWQDATEDREHKPHVRQADGAWGSGAAREDVVAVGFPIEGEFTGDMISPVECRWDVWQWKAARTDPAGYAMDKSHTNTFTDPGGKRYEEELADGRTLYIARPEDAGRSATAGLEPPGSGDSGPRYEAQMPGGSAGDVRASGAWRQGEWTLEFSRALGTGHADDVDLAGRRSIAFALAIFDHSEHEDHATSGVLTLFFP